MIGRVYESNDGTLRARVWQRKDGRWDLEVVRRWPNGGWGHVLDPANHEHEDAYVDEPEALMFAGDYLSADYRAPLRELHVDVLTEGWPDLPPPYKAPEGSPAITVGSVWRKGAQILCVEDVADGGRKGLRITTRNIASAKPSKGSMIVGRKSAAWTYDEETFRKKFKPDTGKGRKK